MRLDRRALDAQPFTAGQLQALEVAIAVNDVVDAEVALPQRVVRDYHHEQLVTAFRLSRQFWREGFDCDALVRMAGALRSGHGINVEDRLLFKDIRARFKHLRFAFVLYAEDHRCPSLFKALTTTMGHLQDGFRQEPPRIARYAGLLGLLLTRPSLMLIDRTVDRLTPSDGIGYARFVTRQMDSLRTMLAQPDLTPSQFHAARKIVSRQVSFHDDFRVLFGGGEHLVMSRYLSAINGLMGQQHDRFVTAGVKGELDYARTAVPLSEDLRARLTCLVSLYD